jgi:ribosome-binding factor A
MAARGFLKAELAHRLQVRRVPDLRFELDRSSEYTARLDALLRRSRQRNPENLDQ